MGYEMSFGPRIVGPGHPPYVIAEIGANHNGDMDLAKKLIDEAQRCGAHAAKFQSWSESSLISEAEFERNTSYADDHRHFGSLREMVREYELSADDHAELARYCASRDIDFLSSAFSPDEVDLLADLGVPAIKIASMDINHLVLLESAAASCSPVILSTGMADLSEIDRAVRFLRDHNVAGIVLLHCVSLYPPPPDTLNLRNIPMLEEAFGCPVGFSDHTSGTAAALGSVALGACVIEKHFTLDRGLPGWDHAISAEPDTLSEICQGAEFLSVALGRRQREVTAAEVEKRNAFRRGIVIRRPLPAGHELAAEDLDYKRPGTGIPPDATPYVLGRTLNRSVEPDHELSWEDLS